MKGGAFVAELRKKTEIQGDIVGHFSEIRNVCDTGVALTKEISNLDDAENISALIDKIFEKIEEVRDLLFEIEDTLDPEKD